MMRKMSAAPIRGQSLPSIVKLNDPCSVFGNLPQKVIRQTLRLLSSPFSQASPKNKNHPAGKYLRSAA
jgi:hypothetical protein